MKLLVSVVVLNIILWGVLGQISHNVLKHKSEMVKTYVQLVLVLFAAQTILQVLLVFKLMDQDTDPIFSPPKDEA